MIRALYVSAQAMNTQLQSLDVVANNIANVNTTGFKGATVVTQSFPMHLMRSVGLPVGEVPIKENLVGQMTFGTTVSDVSINFANGSLEMTSGDLDLALVGDGFFTIGVPLEGGGMNVMYTRAGSFAISPESFLVNQSGYYVLNEAGAQISIPSGPIEINQNGDVIVNSEIVATLGVVSFEDNSVLRQHGYTLFTAIDGAVYTDFSGNVVQGYLERSNVNIIREMVNMVNISRKYEINSRLVGMHDTTLGQAVNEIARN